MAYHEYENFFGRRREEEEEEEEVEEEDEEEAGRKDEEEKVKGEDGKIRSSILKLKSGSSLVGKAKKKLLVPNIGKNKIDLKSKKLLYVDTHF